MVYMVIGGVDYEGEYVLNVFTDKTEALKHAKLLHGHIQNDRNVLGFKYYAYDYVVVRSIRGNTKATGRPRNSSIKTLFRAEVV